MNHPSTNLRELFEAVLALAPSERAAFLDAQCADAALRARIESMLAADASVTEPLSASRVGHLAQAIGADPATPPAGSRIGPFEIMRVIGEGGSATVFEARRAFEGAIQPVALKLLRQSLLSPDARRRFGREQRALIQLQHPHIARMIEGGVTDGGQAYIALELVDGQPITTYAQSQALGMRERLGLFMVVCRAVDAAHRALIVHRDLKPSNVLVTANGEVKLLDFGIAKLLADEIDTDATMLPAFTPAYAAPEQTSGGAITTATDVYALGIVLGELLGGERGGGRTPSAPDGKTTGTAHGPITRRRLRGDLDAVVAKATDADPEQRYASAGALADDIERLLADRPVQAQPQTRWYRMRKFVTRHKGGVATTVAFLLAILASLGIALWQAQVAHTETVRANQQARRAETVRDFIVSIFESAQADVPRERRPTVEQLVDDAGDKLLRDSTIDATVRTDLLLTLAKVSVAIGAYDRANMLLERAAPDVERLPSPSAEALRARVLRAKADLGQARPDAAIALLAPLRIGLASRSDAAAVEALLALADALSGANRSDEAQAVAGDARAVAERSADGREALLLDVDVLRARDFVYAQKFAQGRAVAEDALARWRARSREPSSGTLDLLYQLGVATEFTGDIDRADAAYREAITLAERLYVRPHPDTASAIGIYGSFLVAQARYAEAEPHILHALAMRRALFGDAHPDTLNSIAALGRLRAGQMRDDEARAAFQDGATICAREHVRHSVCPRLVGSLSQMLAARGDLDGALASAEQGVAMQRELSGDGSAQMTGPLGQLARAQVKHARYADALASTDELLAIAARNGSGETKTVRYARFQRALALFALNRNDEALELGRAVVAEQKRKTPDEDTTLFSMLLLQARAAARAGRHDEARSAATEALAIERKPQPMPPDVLPELQRIARTGG